MRPDPESAAALLGLLAARAVRAPEVLDGCLDRIAALDGPIAAVRCLDPSAPDQARASERRRAAGIATGPLDGLPILVKDNVAVSGRPTTAGSRALADSMPGDAPLVTRLRTAGAVVVGKANLSEWANFRATSSSSGWSALGGQVRNPHVLDRSPSGSSSGSAAAVAAGLVPLAVGTETDGSILSPAAACGIVGFKPELGAVPGGGIVPISSRQDVAGPMARTVGDAARLYSALSATPRPRLDAAALRDARIGLWRPAGVDRAGSVLADAVDAIERAGAVTFEVDGFAERVEELERLEWRALLTEFRDELDAYLASAPGAAVRNLAELVEFNRGDDLELSRFGQELLEQALEAPPVEDAGYLAARARAGTLARALIDRPVREYGLDAILTVTNGPAWPIDYVAGDVIDVATTGPAAVAGYPSITVPAGFVGVLPIGVSLIGAAGSTGRLFALAHAFEGLTRARRAPRLLATLAGS